MVLLHRKSDGGGAKVGGAVDGRSQGLTSMTGRTLDTTEAMVSMSDSGSMDGSRSTVTTKATGFMVMRRCQSSVDHFCRGQSNDACGFEEHRSH